MSDPTRSPATFSRSHQMGWWDFFARTSGNLLLLVGNLSGFSSRSFLPPLEASWSIFIFCSLFEHHHYFRLIQWLVGSWQVPSPFATVTTKNGGNDFRQQTRIPTLHHCRYGKSLWCHILTLALLEFHEVLWIGCRPSCTWEKDEEFDSVDAKVQRMDIFGKKPVDSVDCQNGRKKRLEMYQPRLFLGKYLQIQCVFLFRRCA